MGIEQSKITYITLKDLSGGINSSRLSRLIKDKELLYPGTKNVIWNDGGLECSPGHTRILSPVVSTDVITGDVLFKKRDGTEFHVITTNDDIRYFNTATNVWTSIKGALTVSPGLHSFVVFNDHLIGTNGTNSPWEWDGTGNAVVLAGTPPSTAKYVAIFASSVALINCTIGGSHYPTRAYYSAIDNHGTWDLVNRYIETDIDDGEELTGGMMLGQSFALYKRNSIGLYTGVGPTTLQGDRQWKRGVGAVNQHVIESAFLYRSGEFVQVHVFLSEEGLRAFDGSSVYQLPLPNDETGEYNCKEYFSSINTQLLGANAVSVFDPINNRYYCYYPASSSSTNTIGCIYDFNTNSLWPLEGTYVRACSEYVDSSTKKSTIALCMTGGIIEKLDAVNKGKESQTELVTNGNMEAVGTWSAYGTPTTNQQDATHILNGAAAWNVVSNAVLEGMQQDITTVVGKRYRVTAYAYVTAGEAAILLKNPSTGSGVIVSTDATLAAWTKLSYDFTASSTTTTIAIVSHTTAASTFWVDDVSVRCINVVSTATTKFYDFGDEVANKLLEEFVPAAKASGGVLTFVVTCNKGLGDQATDTLTITYGSLDWTAALDWASAVDWSSYSEEVSEALDDIVDDAWRTMQIYISGDEVNLDYNLSKIDILLKSIEGRFFE